MLTSNWNLSKKLLFSNTFNITRRLRLIHNKPLVIYTHQHKLSHHPPFPYPEIPSENSARNLVVHLDDTGRTLLLTELQKFEKERLQLTGMFLRVIFLVV